MVMMPARYCVVDKADIPKCSVRAVLSDVRFHSRDNRLKGDAAVRVGLKTLEAISTSGE
jgi:hypothetical protein